MNLNGDTYQWQFLLMTIKIGLCHEIIFKNTDYPAVFLKFDERYGICQIGMKRKPGFKLYLTCAFHRHNWDYPHFTLAFQILQRHIQKSRSQKFHRRISFNRTADLMAQIAIAAGETNLATLLSTLTTHVHSSTYVFATITHNSTPPASLLTSTSTKMTFRETEGLTIITTLELAQQSNIEFAFRSKMITLEVQSSLEAVGFMAVISTALADNGIGCNPVSAYFHDHIFVPEEKADQAVKVLKGIAERARNEREGN